MKLIYKKILGVVSGYFASLWAFFLNINPFFDALVLCLFFIVYYYFFDKLIEYFELKYSKNLTISQIFFKKLQKVKNEKISCF